MTTDFTVNVNKELVLKGAKLYNFIASDMTVHGATESVIQSRSNLNFISQSLFTFNLPRSLLNIYFNDVYIGYSPLESLTMTPGLNTILNQDIFIEKTSDNKEILDDFFSAYLRGTDQQITMRGPIASQSKGYGDIVIDGIMEQTVNSLGYKKGDLAFGGLVTSASQTGWKINSKTVRGAYSN